MLVNTARSLWTSGYTPQGVVRSLGRWAGKGYVVDHYVGWRFPDCVPSKGEFAEYMYQHWLGEPSGENALNAMLRFGAHAKVPLCHRIPKLDETIPLCFLYGTVDWMDRKAATEVQEVIMKSNSSRECEVLVLPDCGHQLYIENPARFNEAVTKHCQPRRNSRCKGKRRPPRPRSKKGKKKKASTSVQEDSEGDDSEGDDDDFTPFSFLLEAFTQG